MQGRVHTDTVEPIKPSSLPSNGLTLTTYRFVIARSGSIHYFDTRQPKMDWVLSPPSWVCNQHDLSLLIGQKPNKKRAITEPERQKWVIHRNPLCNGLTQNPKPRRRRLLSSIIPQVYGRKAKRKRRWHKTWASIIHRVLHHRPNACFS